MNNELYHYGIKGQQWGRRRYQNKDGSLTPAGEKRYGEKNKKDDNSSTDNKSNYRKKLEAKYVTKGLSPENAAIAANNKIRTQKILGAVAGVTVTAASAYAINKFVKERTDQTIKVGEKMQRIESRKTIFGNKNRNLHDAFYATNNIYDNKNYEDAFGYQKKKYDGKAYKIDITATDNLKIASQKKSRDTFKELLYENEAFRDSLYETNIRADLRGSHNIPRKTLDKLWSGKKVSESTIKKLYDNYNSNLVGKHFDEKEKDNRNIFYNALKKKGYSGIQDINDLKWSNLRGKNPLIIFDKNKVNVEKVHNIVDKVSRKKHDKAYVTMSKLVGKQTITRMLPTVAGITLVSFGASFIPTSSKKVQKIQIQQYKKEHPNTKLSNKEIEQMLKRDKNE